MPSVISSSVARLLLSSTVITPSALTVPMASLIMRPTSSSPPELTVATWRMASPATAVARASMPRTTWATASSMPRRRFTGLAPAATLRRPSRVMAWASTVAVVVPSPALSLVLVATCSSSLAPRFSNGSSSSISLAMVTPSFTTSGAPNFFSSTTLRPLGPMVTLTASARALTPRSREAREASEKESSLAIAGADRRRMATGSHGGGAVGWWGKPNPAAGRGAQPAGAR